MESIQCLYRATLTRDSASTIDLNSTTCARNINLILPIYFANSTPHVNLAIAFLCIYISTTPFSQELSKEDFILTPTMTKIILSISTQLAKAQDEIKTLKQQNVLLNQQNVDLRSRLARYERITPFHQHESHGSHPTAGPTSNSRIRSKGYLKATVASESRSAQPKDTDVSPRRTVTVARKRYAYQDGVIVSGYLNLKSWDTWRNIPRYQTDTRSSLNKQNRWGYPYCCSTPCGSEKDTEETTVEPDHSKGESADNTLAERSMLHDALSYCSPLNHVYIPSNVTYRLLCQAFRLAQETFHNAAREHWPRVWERQRLEEGPHQVLFGFSELASCLRGTETSHMGFLAVRGSCADTVRNALFDMVSVRNDICHYGNRYHKKFGGDDGLLKRCQKLAVVLKDERRAFRIRKIRDILHVQAATIMTEVGALRLLAILPFAQPWKYYHRGLLGSVHFSKGYEPYNYHTIPVEVRNAAEDWWDWMGY